MLGIWVVSGCQWAPYQPINTTAPGGRDLHTEYQRQHLRFYIDLCPYLLIGLFYGLFMCTCTLITLNRKQGYIVRAWLH